jgi:hypothetical protein
VDSTKCSQAKQHLFSEYYSEYHEAETIIEPYGFMTFQVIGEECHIFTMFVGKEYRGSKYSAEMAKKVEDVAISRGCKVAIGYVTWPSPYPEVSLACQFKYGFKIDKINQNQIILRKELKWEP